MMGADGREVVRRKIQRHLHAYVVVTLVLMSYWALYGWLLRQSAYSLFALRSIVGLMLLSIGILLVLLWMAMLIIHINLMMIPIGIGTLPGFNDPFDQQTDPSEDADR